MNQAYIARLMNLSQILHYVCKTSIFFILTIHLLLPSFSPSPPLPIRLPPPHPSPIFASQGWQYASLLLKHIITLASEDAPSPSEGEKS